MSDPVRVMLEYGRKRTVAVAWEWPGWERAGRGTEPENALERLELYRPRYARIAWAAGPAIGAAFDATGALVVEDHQPSSGTTDYFGVSGRSATAEHGPVADDVLERRLALVRAAWAHFDHLALTVSPELRQGRRPSERNRDKVVRHTLYSELDFSKRLGVREEFATLLDVDGRARYRDAFVDAIRACNAAGGTTRTWTLQFVIRRTIFHTLDHAWELEDKDLTGEA